MIFHNNERGPITGRPFIPFKAFNIGIMSISVTAWGALGLAGCGHSDTGDAARKTAGDQAKGKAAMSSTKPALGGLHTIGLTVQSIQNPFFVAIQNGVSMEGKKSGAETTLQDGRQDIGNQTNIVDDFVQQHVDLIVLNAVDSAGIAPAVARARKAGIPVVAVDVGAQGGVSATITSDNVQAGEIAAQYMADRLHGSGSIAVVDGPPVTAVQDRAQGLKNVLAKYPNIKVVSTQVGDGSRDRALQLGTTILTANPHLDAVFAINDPTALGVELAARQAGRKDFFIVGIDGSPDIVADMKAHGLVAASAAQDPNKLGTMAVQIGAQIAAGQKPPHELIKLPVTLVTQENVNAYKGWK